MAKKGVFLLSNPADGGADINNFADGLRRLGVEVNSDSNVKAGEDWARKISEMMGQAVLGVAFVSSDLIASDFDYQRIQEMMKGPVVLIHNRATVVTPDMEPLLVPNRSALASLESDGKGQENRFEVLKQIQQGIVEVVKRLEGGEQLDNLQIVQIVSKDIALAVNRVLGADRPDDEADHPVVLPLHEAMDYFLNRLRKLGIETQPEDRSQIVQLLETLGYFEEKINDLLVEIAFYQQRQESPFFDSNKNVQWEELCKNAESKISPEHRQILRIAERDYNTWLDVFTEYGVFNSRDSLQVEIDGRVYQFPSLGQIKAGILSVLRETIQWMESAQEGPWQILSAPLMDVVRFMRMTDRHKPEDQANASFADGFLVKHEKSLDFWDGNQNAKMQLGYLPRRFLLNEPAGAITRKELLARTPFPCTITKGLYLATKDPEDDVHLSNAERCRRYFETYAQHGARGLTLQEATAAYMLANQSKTPFLPERILVALGTAFIGFSNNSNDYLPASGHDFRKSQGKPFRVGRTMAAGVNDSLLISKAVIDIPIIGSNQLGKK